MCFFLSLSLAVVPCSRVQPTADAFAAEVTHGHGGRTVTWWHSHRAGFEGALCPPCRRVSVNPGAKRTGHPPQLDLPAAPAWHPQCNCIYTTCIYTTQDQRCIRVLVMNGTTASLGHLHRVSDLTSSNKPANEVFSRHRLSAHNANFM